MKKIIQTILPFFGVIVIIFQLLHTDSNHRGLDSHFWGFLLGFGLIISPLKAVGMLAMYILILTFIIIFPILGAYIGTQITGKDSIGGFLGLISGGIIGLKLATGNFFHTLMAPLRRVAEQDSQVQPTTLAQPQSSSEFVAVQQASEPAPLDPTSVVRPTWEHTRHPERFCGFCRTLVIPKRRLRFLKVCPRCGNSM